MASPESSVPVIRYVDQAQGGDLSMVPEAVRPYAFRSYQHMEVGILVSDMSGFTKLTRKYGAVHFTSIIARTRQLCLPILHKYGAILITAEGDSLNVVFATAEGAVLAALDMQSVAREYNKTLPEARAHFALTLNGVGVDIGPGPILDREGKLHGQTFANAHLLGEELCSKGRVAISQKCYNRITTSGEKFANASFQPMPLPDNREASEAMEHMGGIFEVAMESLEPIAVTSCDLTGYLQEEFMQLCQRHSPTISDIELASLDEEIKRKYMQRKVVLMLDFDYENVDTPATALGLKFECLSRLAEVFKTHNACQVEDVLYLFDDPVDAILAATNCRAAVQSFRNQVDDLDAPQVSIKGFGVHTGEILFIEGTDVHWGDPVNTSSKLGQDLAENSDIIISKATYDCCSNDPRLEKLIFEQFECEISGVKFEPYKVIDKYAQAPQHLVKHRSESMFFEKPDELPTIGKEEVFEKLESSGFASDSLLVDSKVIADLMRGLDPNYTDEQIAETISHVQKGGGLTFAALFKWAFADPFGSPVTT